MTYSLVVRRQAFELFGDGVSVGRVAEMLGVSSRTLKIWRAEVGGVFRQQSAQSGRYLSRDERYEIARLHDGGLGVRAIATRMGRAASTISRELGRPTRPVGAAGRTPTRGGLAYQPEAAHQAALRARARPRATKLSQNPHLRAWVQNRLDRHDSPEQVAGRLAVDFPDDKAMHISHETIYRAIYVQPRGELRRQLRAHLRTSRTQRKQRNTRQTRHRAAIANPVTIHDRPTEIEGRTIPGHYEGDLVVGPLRTSAAIGTLVERTSGHLTAFKIDQKTTAATMAGLTAALTRTGWPVQSLTWDRGPEMAGHAQFTIDTGIQIYFADPYAPWQRGSNESANGLLRQYIPKGLDIATVTDEEIQASVDQLNDRPRKRHGFLTPNEVLAAILANDQGQSNVATTA